MKGDTRSLDFGSHGGAQFCAQFCLTTAMKVSQKQVALKDPRMNSGFKRFLTVRTIHHHMNERSL